jgi:hypothetical protein
MLYFQNIINQTNHMNEGMPQENHEEELATEDVEAALKAAENMIHEKAPSIQEKKDLLKKSEGALGVLYKSCGDLTDKYFDICKTLLSEEEKYTENAAMIDFAMKKGSHYFSLTNKCAETIKLLGKEALNYDDYLLEIGRYMMTVTSRVTEDVPSMLAYRRKTHDVDIESSRVILSSLQDCQKSYDKLPLELQAEYTQDINRTHFLINQTNEIIQSEASVHYKEGQGLIIDKELK